ncbi:glycosyltransferase family 4 protein [Flavobacterium zepuense]|uniref:Glycosyltransferase family 4 protein n=1 Tax=Flavobacterium zepuense TaxID=2593302 RepID=A0A552UXP7_9FLAO|nr:glycosyltransferase [Flavobacterium zepuense]TRW22977.1 glycosyltransferase family 4 protein [Flavobacterium zepuense]
MKILLVGEYSRLHNSLKEGLTHLGHDVVIVSTGDSFKNFATDYSIAARFFERSWFLKKTAGALLKVTGINLFLTEKGLRFYNLLPKLKGFDHIQLINSDALETHPTLAKRLYKKLLQHNNSSLSLLICGDETPIIDYYLTGKLKYSVLTPYLKDNSLKSYFSYPLKYINKPYRNLFEWIKANAICLITSDLDYEVPMKAMGHNTIFIPNPINSAVISFIPPVVGNKVIIFLGINRMSYIKKGITYFEDALAEIAKKYPDTVEVIVTENIPYAKYITLYNSAHIVLDQVYAYDQGYNALEAMAKGKVVFTGAETEFTQYYNLTQKVAINALPDVDALVADLSFLIENPQEIVAIGTRARSFIEKEHNYIEVAKKYLEAWRLSNS